MLSRRNACFVTWRDVESALFTTSTNLRRIFFQGVKVGALATNRHGRRNARGKTAARALNAPASLDCCIVGMWQNRISYYILVYILFYSY